MQSTHTHFGVELAAVARACSFPVAETVYEVSELQSAIPKLFSVSGPVFLGIKVNTQRYPMSIRMRDGAYIKNRFRENLLGKKAFD